MYKVFQYRMYPTKPQEQRLESVRETCRRWYNNLLSERKVAYEERGETITKFVQLKRVKEYRATNAWAAEVQSHVLQVVVLDLDRAFQGFFRRVKAGQTPGYPRFKAKRRFSSFGYREHGNGFKVHGRRLRLSGIGRVAIRWHRPLEGTIKTLRVTQKAGKWYASFACEVAPEPLAPTGKDVGIDVGIASLLTSSNGVKVENPRWYRVAQRKLRVAHRRIARRKPGGANRRKAVVQLQREYAHLANRRADYLKKLAHRLVHEYDRIALEDLRITNMTRNHHMAKSILDTGWGYLVRHLMNKAAEAGRLVCLVDPQYTSKTCSDCGRIFENLTLRDRWLSCVCGLSLDRDHNAAINILSRAGQVRWAVSPSLDGLAQEPASL